MRLFRIFFPFLFVRNWYSGDWEFSYVRFGLFLAFLILFFIAIGIIIVLQAPVEYSSSI